MLLIFAIIDKAIAIYKSMKDTKWPKMKMTFILILLSKNTHKKALL